MKRAKVNKDACIGCGACQGISEVFEIGDDGLAKVVIDPINEDLEEDAICAEEGCPTAAISIEDAKENKD